MAKKPKPKPPRPPKRVAIAFVLFACLAMTMFFPVDALADCSGGACRLGAVVRGPAKVVKAIRNREHKPLARLFGRR